MGNLTVFKAPKIEVELCVPGDKSISHRAILFSGLSNGTCVVSGFLPSEDCLCTVNVMRELGVRIDHLDKTTLLIEGRRGEFQKPLKPLNCGNSGTLMRLMCGILATQSFETTLVGDDSLSCRPMRRVVEPLARMGANFRLTEPKGTPPIVVQGGKLRPIQYELPVASAQVKSAILFAALRTSGQTTVVEPLKTRDHTERMMIHYSIAFQKQPAGAGFNISLSGDQTPEARDFIVPGDISSAAFWLVAAAAQENSRLVVRNVGLNRTRSGVLSVLERMGAQIKEIVWDSDEPRGEVQIGGVQLHGTEIGGQEIPNVIDEIPILAVAGALAQGKTVIRNAGELRVKETDRLTAIATNLSAMGVKVAEFDDGLEIQGGSSLTGAHLDSFGDHRIAMAFAIAGMFATGETVISRAECIATSYPGFEEQLKRFFVPEQGQAEPVINKSAVKL